MAGMALPVRNRIYSPCTRLRVLMRAFILLCFCHASLGYGQESRQNFTVKSRDGVNISGDIALPKRGGKVGAVLFVPGTGLFDRHVSYGVTRSKDDYLFDSLQTKILAAGFAVVRFDLRGVSCNFASAPTCEACKSPQEKSKHYFSLCVSNPIRSGVNVENMREDIEAVFKHAQSHPRLLSEDIAVVAHSEGGAHVAALVGARAIVPKALLLASPVLSSPVEVMKWQLGGVVDQWLASLIGRDDFLPNKKIETAHPAWASGWNYPLSELRAPEPKTGWTRAELEARAKTRHDSYEQQQAKLRDVKSTDPFAYTGDVVHASFGWWQWWHGENTPVAQHLSAFGKPVYVYYGNLDPKVDVAAQIAHVSRAVSETTALNAAIRVFPKLGHSLGSHPLFGPIARTVEDNILSDLVRELGASPSK